MSLSLLITICNYLSSTIPLPPSQTILGTTAPYVRVGKPLSSTYYADGETEALQLDWDAALIRQPLAWLAAMTAAKSFLLLNSASLAPGPTLFWDPKVGDSPGLYSFHPGLVSSSPIHVSRAWALLISSLLSTSTGEPVHTKAG
jgi:hypothetical protein